MMLLNSCSEKKSNHPELAIAIPPINKIPWIVMGWNTIEAEVWAVAEYVAKNPKHPDYGYIVNDQMWYGDAKASNFEDFVHEFSS